MFPLAAFLLHGYLVNWSVNIVQHTIAAYVHPMFLIWGALFVLAYVLDKKIK